MCGVVRARDNSPGGNGQMGYKMVVAGGLNKDGYTDVVEIYDMMRDKWNMGELVLYSLKDNLYYSSRPL